MRAPTHGLLVLVALALAACDPLGDATVAVDVEPAALSRAGLPARVLVVSDHGDCVQEVGRVAAGEAAPHSFTWTVSGVCPQRQVLRFWLEPYDGPAPDDETCVRRGGPAPDTVAQPIFERGDCNEGPESHSLTLR